MTGSPAFYRDKQVLAWACYDWANSAFATTVIAGFFPVFFKQYCNEHVTAAVSTFRLGITNSLAALIVALLAPFLAALADSRSTRKKYLLFFTALSILATAALGAVSPGQWLAAAVLFAAALVCFDAALIFYDSFLPLVAKGFSSAAVSSLGYALGYLGGGILFALNVFMYLRPEVFHLNAGSTAVKASFVTVGAWWAVFSLPLLWLVKESKPAPSEIVSFSKSLRSAGYELRQTAAKAVKMKNLLLFLLAYWLYIDGVNTVVKMAVDYGAALGFGTPHLIGALLLTQFIGFPSALVFGRLGRRLGAIKSISAGLAVYMLVTIWASFMHHAWEFYALAAVIGLVQGGVQALSRALYADMIPADESAQFFCFFNLIGKSAAIIGPVLVGATTYLTGSSRAGLYPLLLLFLAGLILLQAVSANQRLTTAKR